jgi:hypothetical protein
VWKIRIIDTVASGERAKMTPSGQDANPFSKCGGTTQKLSQRDAQCARRHQRQEESLHFSA